MYKNILPKLHNHIHRIEIQPNHSKAWTGCSDLKELIRYEVNEVKNMATSMSEHFVCMPLLSKWVLQQVFQSLIDMHTPK